MLILSLTGLVLGAVISERDVSERRLSEEEGSGIRSVAGVHGRGNFMELILTGAWPHFATGFPPS